MHGSQGITHTPCGRTWKDMCPTFQEVTGKSSLNDMSSQKGLTPENEGRNVRQQKVRRKAPKFSEIPS